MEKQLQDILQKLTEIEKRLDQLEGQKLCDCISETKKPIETEGQEAWGCR